MSYYLIDLEKDFDFNKIIIGKKIQINDTTNRYYIYYLDDKPKDIYVKIPVVRLLFNYQSMKYNQIKLPIFPIWEKTSLFLNFIKKLEKYLRKNIKSDSVLYSSIENNDEIKQLKINIPKNLKIKSNINNITFNDFKQSGEIEMIVKIPHVFEKNQSLGLSITAYQVKYSPPGEIDFWDDEPSPIYYKPNKQTINESQEIPIQLTSSLPKPKIGLGVSIIPSQKDLLNAISRLKKVE
jgi:hypothetical protein